MLSALLAAVAGTSALVPLWLVAGTAGMLLTRRYYRRRGQRLGVTGYGRRTWVIAGVMFALCLTAGIVGGMTSGEAAGLLIPVGMVLAGYLVLGWLQHSLAPSLALAPGAAVAAALVLAGVTPWLIELIFGAAMVAAGAGLRAAEVRS